MPVFNEEAGLAEALESLLAQTEEHLRIAIVDNASTDASADIAAAFAAEDPRVTVERNGRHVGAVDNWRRAFWRARELHPDAAYFAGAGARDRWQPRWFETLAGRLDADPGPSGAFARGRDRRPGSLRASGQAPWRDRWPSPARDRMARQLPGLWVHSLFARSTSSGSVAPAVLLPDRLTMALLASQGELDQVDERLWLRRAPGQTPKSYEQRVPSA